MQDEFVGRVLEVRIGGRYQLLKRLGSGSFGQVYLGHDLYTGDEVAIKLEHYSIAPSFLDQEVQIYETLSEQPGFPRLFWHGYQDDFRVMVFELLGPNLEDLLRYCDNRFSLKTTLMLMDQLLSRMESLHATGHHHRDIKPENFLLGTGKQGNVLYMTDLGLAIYRQEPKSGSINRESGKSRPPSLIGTCRYASISGHLDIPSSRSDDLESLGYMAIYFLHGQLPWQGLRAPTREERYKLVLKQKQSISVKQLCGDSPPEFATYMDYVRGLGSHDRPDYKYLRKMFRNLFRRKGFEFDFVFDWTIREFSRLHRQLAQTSSGDSRR